jgi:hypothetical protein
MAYEFTKAAKEAYGFSGLAQKVLWFLCDEISASQKEKYMKSRVGFVCRSYDYLAFRNACNRTALTAVFKKLTEVGVVKAKKRGPHRFYLFCVYLDKLIALRRTWKEEQIYLGFRKPIKDDPMDIAEEELQWEDEATAEALEDSVDTPMVDPMTDEELGEDFPTLPEATSGSIASGNGKKSLHTLPEVTSTAREAMSGKSEAMSGVTRGNVWNSKSGVHLADSTSLPSNVKKSIGCTLSGAQSGSKGVGEDDVHSSVPEGPSSPNEILLKSKANPTPQPKAVAVDDPNRPAEVCRHGKFKQLCPTCKKIEDTRSWATTPSEKKPSRVPIFDTTDMDGL